MARSRITINSKQNSTSSLLFHFLSLTPFSSLLSSSPTKSKNISSSSSVVFFSLITLFSLSLIIILTSTINNIARSSKPCSVFPSFSTNSSSGMFFSDEKEKLRLSVSEMEPLPAHGVPSNLTEEEALFWKQPNNEGYEPCLRFDIGYRKQSPAIISQRKRFLAVFVSGGLNQQRNQIVDAVVIARILKASLLVPILKVNFIWGDESEFSDIFDVEHFKRTLQADVRIVSTLPFKHLVSTVFTEDYIPYDVSPLWLQTRYSKELNEEGLLVLKGLDSKLSKNLPSDLQKLRCKVAFHALRFANPIQELGNRLARRMWNEGPYISLHLRLEKDVWLHTGCETGLGPDYDEIIREERSNRPEYLTGRLNMSYPQRRLAGLCPLNAGMIDTHHRDQQFIPQNMMSDAHS